MKICIFGASGFSKEVADVSADMGYQEIIFIDIQPRSDTFFGFRLISEDNIGKYAANDFHFIIGIGNNKLRQNIYERFAHLKYVNIIHSTASMGIGQKNRFDHSIGNIITAGVRMTNDIKLGNFGIYNLNCTIGHDCVIEDFINIAPSANISGNVHIKSCAYIGANATILQGKAIDKKLIIGENATVGAGAVATKDVPPNVIVKGIPARI